MFIRINDQRIKSTSIGEFEVRGKSQNSEKWFIDVKVSGKSRLYYFESEQRMSEVSGYLDKVLDVKEV